MAFWKGRSGPSEAERLFILGELIRLKTFAGGIWTERGGESIYAKEFLSAPLKFVTWGTAARLIGMKPIGKSSTSKLLRKRRKAV